MLVYYIVMLCEFVIVEFCVRVFLDIVSMLFLRMMSYHIVHHHHV